MRSFTNGDQTRMKTIVSLQLVWLREQSFDNGTEFVVVDQVTDGQTPVQVDAATAGAWVRSGWAAEKAAHDDSAPATTPTPALPARGREKR